MSQCTLFYIIGQPGAGKTSLMRAITDGLYPIQVNGPVPHLKFYDNTRLAPVAMELGRRREGGFSGTDALSMNIRAKALAWLATRPHRIVLAEGDRLADIGFLSAVEAEGIQVELIHLDTPDSIACERREIRGSKQSPTWIRGRKTKVMRLTYQWLKTRPAGYKSPILSGTMSPDYLAGYLRGFYPETLGKIVQ